MKYTKALFNLNFKQRKTTIEKAFTTNINYEYKDKKILILDDIISTGSTMKKIASLLKAKGAKEITGLTLSYTT